jgi:hypothetical protein
VGRRGLLGFALAALLLTAGCGGDGEATLTFGGSDEEQIVATVNAMTAAIAAGEGAVACELMTEGGQDVMLRVGRQAGGQDVADCAAAVPAAESAGYDPGDFRITPGDVAIDGDAAEARCDLDGAFMLERTGEGWRVDVPYCNH